MPNITAKSPGKSLKKLASSASSGTASGSEEKHPFLIALGERARNLRARRGMTRKAVALAAGVSERHMANLEYGEGNASILVLHQVAQALQCSLAELVGDLTTATPEWLMLRELLQGQDDAALQRVRQAAAQALGVNVNRASASPRIALVGLRGAGKSTLGRMLGEELGLPFVELGREIERVAGCSVGEIQALYGMSAYRRYERRALDEMIAAHPEMILATPGGIVSDTATFNQLLSHCTTIWLKAAPEDHMRRVQAQGDLRPMAASKEAMDDLKGILAGRAAFYSKAQFSLNTSGIALEQAFVQLRQIVRDALQRPA